MRFPSTHAQSLVDLGFTTAEAETYLFLLTESPTSAYRIAKAVGRPASQVYRALESLERKGALMTAEEKSRLWRAVPLATCLAGLERDFAVRKARAEEALRDLPRPADDERVYHLESRSQVIEQCRAMMHRAEHVVLLDVFPEPLGELRGDVEDLIARDVRVAAKFYEDAGIEGADLHVIPADAEHVLGTWIGQTVNIASDGREFVSAFLSRDGREVLDAFWSANAYLAAMYYNGLSCELCYSHLTRAALQGKGREGLRAMVRDCEPFHLTNSPAMEAVAIPTSI